MKLKISPTSFKWDAKLYQKSSQWQFDLGMMAIERLAPQDGENILEIGCGNAMITIEIAKIIPHGSITAIELSEEMIKQAKINLSNTMIKNVKILHINALDIKFDKKFDAVFSNSAIHWILDLKLIYSLFYDALKKNGRIMVQTGLKEINLMFKALFKINKLPEYKNILNSVQFPWRYLSIKETKSILKKVGFRDIKVEPYKYYRKFHNIEEFLNFSKAAALVPYLNEISSTLKEDFINKYKAIVKEMISPENIEIEIVTRF